MTALLAIICGVLVVGLDQLTKYLITIHMDPNEIITVIPSILKFHRIPPNTGIAFGNLEGQTWMIITVTVFIMIICIGLLIRKTFDSKLMFWALCLVLGGGVGNLIDRVFRGGGVIDFLEFGFIDFPVFNVADVAVCVGAGLMFLYFVVDFVRDWRGRSQRVSAAFEEIKTDTETTDKEAK